jgi:ATP/maltotriose-dependent transcriptional regulator MalT
MTEWQQRVVSEKADLDGRRDRINEFIVTTAFDGLPPEDRALLVRQSAVMRMLSDVLGERLARFELVA